MYNNDDMSLDNTAVIKVIGVGGGGGNAVHHMLASGFGGVEFICANTDNQALRGFEVSGYGQDLRILHIGKELTKGLGAGAIPSVGAEAAKMDKDAIAESIHGADMLFIAAGMGGGTGTGAAPIVASIAREMGILTVAVVTRPFYFEGPRRKQSANEGIKNLAEHVDSLIVIPNDRLLKVLGSDTSMKVAFEESNNVLLNAVQGISQLITSPGVMNVDFADVRTVMSARGMAMMGTGEAKGENRAQEAAEIAIRSPLLEDMALHGAQGILVNLTGGPDISMGEFTAVGESIEDLAGEDATIVVGTSIEPDMGDSIRVTIVAAGLDASEATASQSRRQTPPPAPAPKAMPQSTQQRQTGYQHQSNTYPTQRTSSGGIPKQAPAPRDTPRSSELNVPGFLKKNIR